MNPYDERVVSNFIVQTLEGEEITIYGNGNPSQSFCYVDDLIEGIYGLMNSRDGFTGPVNIGNSGEFTMLELAELVLQLTESKSKLVFMPLPQDDPMQRQPIIDLARNEFGWMPTIKLEQGLIRDNRVI